MGIRVWYEMSELSMKFAMWKEIGNYERSVYIGAGNWKVVKNHELYPQEAFHELPDPQGFLDALLQAGVRPSENKWSAGHVSDLKEHIKFAEKVASRLLDRAPGA